MQQAMWNAAANQLVVESDSDEDEIHSTPRVAPRAQRAAARPPPPAVAPDFMAQQYPQQKVEEEARSPSHFSYQSSPNADASSYAHALLRTPQLETVAGGGGHTLNNLHKSMRESNTSSLASPLHPETQPLSHVDSNHGYVNGNDDHQAGAPLAPVMLEEEISDDYFLQAMGFKGNAGPEGPRHYVEGGAAQKSRIPAFTVAPPQRPGLLFLFYSFMHLDSVEREPEDDNIDRMFVCVFSFSLYLVSSLCCHSHSLTPLIRSRLALPSDNPTSTADPPFRKSTGSLPDVLNSIFGLGDASNRPSIDTKAPLSNPIPPQR